MCSSSSTRLVARAAINSAVPDYDCRCAVPALELNLAALIYGASHIRKWFRKFQFVCDEALECLYVDWPLIILAILCVG